MLTFSDQPPNPYLDTYAGTTDVTNRIFLHATTITSARTKGDLDRSIVADFDVPAAFLNEKRYRRQAIIHSPPRQSY